MPDLGSLIIRRPKNLVYIGTVGEPDQFSVFPARVDYHLRKAGDTFTFPQCGHCSLATSSDASILFSACFRPAAAMVWTTASQSLHSM